MEKWLLDYVSLEHFEQEHPQQFYLGPCDTFSIPARNGCQALTVIEAETVGASAVAMRRESGAVAQSGLAGVARKLYKKHYAIWVN